MGQLFTVLAFANFVIGMGGFVVIGVLSPIAAGFGISRPDAGWAMTAYALVYGVASPLGVALTGQWDRKRVLLLGLGVFFAGALAAALAPSFSFLLAARAFMAVGAGLVTPVAASIAAALAPPEERGAALAKVFGGLTLAQVFGVPVGAKLGYAFGWQSAFVAVALLSALGAAVLWRLAPAGVRTPTNSFRSLAAALADLRLMNAVAFTAIFIGALYVLYTFLARFLEVRAGLSGDGVTIVLVLYGVGAVAGNWLGGRLSDGLGARRTLALLCCAQIVIMPALTLTYPPVAVIVAGLCVWSVFGWSVMAPQQSRLAGLDPVRTPVLLALNASAIYLGASLGSFIGGAALKAADFWALGPIGAIGCLLALATLWRREKAT